MTTLIEVRRLEEADLPDYKALRDHMLAAHPSAFTSDAAEALALTPQSYRGRLGPPQAEAGEFLLGAWEQERLVGCIACERDRRVKAHHIGHIVGMMVHGDQQGRGVGRALLADAIARARSASGLVTLTLSVTADNLAAVALYEHMGFVRYGRLPRAIRVEGRYFTKDLMALDLG